MVIRISLWLHTLMLSLLPQALWAQTETIPDIPAPPTVSGVAQNDVIGFIIHYVKLFLGYGLFFVLIISFLVVLWRLIAKFSEASQKGDWGEMLITIAMGVILLAIAGVLAYIGYNMLSTL